MSICILSILSFFLLLLFLSFPLLSFTPSQAGRDGVAASPGGDARLGLDVVDGSGGRTALDNKTSLLNTPSPRSFCVPRTREHAPYGYADTISAYDKSALKEAVFDDDVEQFRDSECPGPMVPSLLAFSHHLFYFPFLSVPL